MVFAYNDNISALKSFETHYASYPYMALFVIIVIIFDKYIII